MKVSDVRSRFLAFYKARGHAVIPSAPIVPGNDPTTLFTSSGMQPLVPYLLGKDHPEGSRLVDSQMSFRAGDIEEVGDNRHTTFFEMLGNWSLGDYFKQEQLPWLFEFLTSKEEGLGLDPARLYVTVFAGDEATGMPADQEAVEIWQTLFAQKSIDARFATIGSEEAGYEKGMQPDERIFAYDAKKNWWSRAGIPANMPAGEPGGPDSEAFYDFMPDTTFPGGHATPDAEKVWGPQCHPNCDCGRFVEIGNSVFMQFVKDEDGSFSNLPKQNVDFGGGLERLTFATIGTPDVFRIDVFDAARAVLEERSGETYGADEATTRAMRIILDHMRASTFMIAEGIVPSNTEAGYVLRRLIRRAIREADRLGVKDQVLADVAEGFGEAYAGHYPHVAEHAGKIREELAKEEEQFRKTLTAGKRELEKSITIFIPGENVPAEIITELQNTLPVLAKYAPGEEIPKHLVINGDVLFHLFSTYGFPAELSLEELDKLRVQRGLSPLGDERKQRLLEEYSTAMKKHQEQSRQGGAQRFAGGLADHAEQTVRYHTTHHILLKALQMVLGPDVHQRGSNITSERLRIDFSSPGKMTDEQKAKVEEIVNDIIYQDLPVTRTVMPRTEAETLGAEMEFGVKYPDTVSVYSVGPAHATQENPDIPNAFSLEFCGGPHVTNTAEIHEGGKRFKIKKEEAVASGVRRIKGILV